MGLIDDLVHAFRSLTRRPTVTVFAAATLALGIGSTTAIFRGTPVCFRPRSSGPRSWTCSGEDPSSVGPSRRPSSTETGHGSSC
jgi:hypothetical protein